MPLATFSDLVTELAVEFGRSDLSTSRVEILCAQVEAALNNNSDFNIADQLTTASVSTVANQSTVTLPTAAKWIESIIINNEPRYLQYKARDAINAIYRGDYVARPEVFCVQSIDTVILAPTPDSVYGLDIVYGQNIPALTLASPTNWLMSRAPLVYLYGCAYFNSLKIKDMQQMAVYQVLYGQMVDGLMSVDSRYRLGSDIALTPTVRVRSESY